MVGRVTCQKSVLFREFIHPYRKKKRDIDWPLTYCIDTYAMHPCYQSQLFLIIKHDYLFNKKHLHYLVFFISRDRKILKCNTLQKELSQILYKSIQTVNKGCHKIFTLKFPNFSRFSPDLFNKLSLTNPVELSNSFN